MIFLVVVAVLVAGYIISTYNWFQTAKTRLTASLQEIGNQLKRQASLIPNLETSAKTYLKHEKGIYKAITDARKSIDKAVESGKAELIDKASDQISKLLPKLQILVESNPEMKGEKVISKLMNELRDTSDKLMYARRTLIDLSADFNRRLITIPSSFVGKLFKFEKQKGVSTPASGAHVEVSATETKTPRYLFRESLPLFVVLRNISFYELISLLKSKYG